tara:strand:+ start:8249 stop:9211 length:963 start_codon:yes stop_codon:yes gene_type:complete
MADYNYQAIKDIVAKNGALQEPGSQTPAGNQQQQQQGGTISGTAEFDLAPYQQAVLALEFSEETDTTFDSSVTATAADPSVDVQLGIDASGKNTYIPSAAGGSLLLNSDRVIINAKEDYAMLFGQKGVAIASPKEVNIDSQTTVTLFGHERVYIGLPNAGGDQKEATKRTKPQTVGHPTQDELYEPLVLGIKLANLLEDFIVTLETAKFATPVGDAVFQPSSTKQLELIKVRIPEILSNYGYVDGISHEKIDEDRLNAVMAATATDFVAPTKLIGTVTGEYTPYGPGNGPVTNPNPVTSPLAALPGFYETPSKPPYEDSL